MKKKVGKKEEEKTMVPVGWGATSNQTEKANIS